MTPPPNLPAARCTRCGYTEIAPSHIYSHDCGEKLPAHPDLSPPQPEKGKGGEGPGKSADDLIADVKAIRKQAFDDLRALNCDRPAAIEAINRLEQTYQ